MSGPLLIVGAFFVGVASLVHVFIFVLESLLWSRPSTWRRFGVHSQEESDTIRAMAYNQGFYNGFLALGGVAALVLLAVGMQSSGVVLAIFVLLCMLLAALVLITSNPRLARAAATQGLAPLIGLIFLVLSVAT